MTRSSGSSPAREPRFTADHMVLRLGRYLRLLGYDVFHDPRLRTHELILISNREDRIFLSRNRRLAEQYPSPHRLLLLPEEDPVAQFRYVVNRLSLDARQAFSRCAVCNHELRPADRSEAAGRVPADVLEKADTLRYCPGCGRFYWEGTHVRNTRRRLGIDGERVRC